ncbi:MAG: hypothetical protein AAF376_10950 [Pseudomonadota bacterium]
MMMVELTSVPSDVLPVTELAGHLRLAHGFADDGSQDAQLESCLRSAIAAIEARIGKALFARRFSLTLVHWQRETAHVLPTAPVQSVDSVTLVNRAGGETLVDAEAYDLIADMHQPSIRAAGGTLPAPSRGGTIEVEFTAGFGATWPELPADLRQAVLILAGEYWGQNLDPEQGIPFSVSVLLEPHRALRLRSAVQ